VYPGSPVTSPPSTTATMPTETTTTTELTATMPTETSTTTQLTTTGISRSDWEPVDGGEGRACRGASRSDNKPQYYKVVRGIASLEDCQMTCAATAGCRGVEFSRQRCEVWLRAEGIEATLALPGFVCMRYGGPVATTTTPMMGTWPPVDGGDGRACRGASRSDNSADYYTVLPGLVNLDTCKARCQITNGCQGVEFSIGRCEIWTRPGGIQASIALQGFTCLGYQSAAVSTMPPSTATTTATASTSEPPATTTASAACVGAWQQCGGRNHAGATCCVEGYLCVMDNEWYSQCQPTPMPAFAQAAAQKRGSRRQKFLGPSFMQSKAKAWKGASQPPLEKWEL
ncbi:manF, partial [Symbiodinium microadriaticum]